MPLPLLNRVTAFWASGGNDKQQQSDRQDRQTTLCKKSLSYTVANTSTMQRHLENHHSSQPASQHLFTGKSTSLTKVDSLMNLVSFCKTNQCSCQDLDSHVTGGPDLARSILGLDMCPHTLHELDLTGTYEWASTGGIVLFYASGLCRSSFLTDAHQQMFNWSTTVIDLWHLSAFIFCEMHEGMYTFSIIIQMCLCAVQSSCSGGERGKRRGAYGYRCERHRPERQQTYFCEWHFPGRSGRGLAKKYFIPSI